MRPRTDRTSTDRPVTLREVQALVDTHVPTPVRLHDPVWMTNFRLHNRGARHYRTGNVFLAGDAAHIHSPAGAQGMNTGIQDAVNLGWKLALVTTGSADPALLDTYENEREPVGRSVLRFTDRAFTIATSTSPIIRFVRARLAPRLIPLVNRSRRGRAVGFRTISQLGIRYRHSPLSLDGPGAPRNGPGPGDRLPDAPITHHDRISTLHAAVAAPSFHLLLCGPATTWDTPAGATLPRRYADRVAVHHLTRDNVQGAFHDHTGEATRRLGLQGSTQAHYLIRPDGHVAYRGGSDLHGLHAYLATWL